MKTYDTRWRRVVSSSHPGRSIPGTHGIKGLLGPRASLDAVAKRKIRAPAGTRTPVVQPVA